MFYVINFSQFWCEVDHFFPILARDLFPKLLEKALMFELKRWTIPGVSEQACNILILFPSSPIMLGPFINLMADKMVLTSTTPLPSVSNCWNAYKMKHYTGPVNLDER